jgi:hypothetical protein
MAGTSKKARLEPGFLNTSSTRRRFTSESADLACVRLVGRPGPASGSAGRACDPVRPAGHSGPGSASAGRACDLVRLAVGRPCSAVRLGLGCSLQCLIWVGVEPIPTPGERQAFHPDAPVTATPEYVISGSVDGRSPGNHGTLLLFHPQSPQSAGCAIRLSTRSMCRDGPEQRRPGVKIGAFMAKLTETPLTPATGHSD